ncbi:MAG TPA: hypothetical protein VGI42_04030, partial [Chthoniobacterales bacterium]
MELADRKLLAFTLPMAVFLLLLGVASALEKIGGAFWVASPAYWIFPLQTLLCGALLICFWRNYQLIRPQRPIFTLTIALIVFAL